MKSTIILSIFFSFTFSINAIINPRILPGTTTHNEAILFWEKPADYVSGTSYQIFIDGIEKANTTKNNFKITGLLPSTTYSIVIKSTPPTGNGMTSDAVNLTTSQAPAKIINVTTAPYNAKGDNSTLNTSAIQKAIDDCPAYGIVYIPSGTYITGALFIKKNNISVELASGATLKAHNSLASFPMVNTSYEGRERQAYSSVLNIGTRDGGVRYNNIRIYGGGTIDNQGSILANQQTNAKSRSDRSHGLPVINCDNVAIDGITITNPCTWNVHPIYCNGFTTYNCTILSDGMGLSNADGWDPDSSTQCYLVNSTIESHDDHIAIKSGVDAEGRAVGKPSEYIYVSQCLLKHGGGIAIGSEQSGGVRNVWFTDITMQNSDRGFHVKARPGRGATVENIYFKDITVQKSGGWGISVDTWYYVENHIANSRNIVEIPTFRNIYFENITVDNTNGNPIQVIGPPEIPIENIYFKNVTFKNSEFKVLLRNCKNIYFDNVNFLDSDKYWVVDNAANILRTGSTKDPKTLNYPYTLVDKDATFATKALYYNLMQTSKNGKFYFGAQDATASGYKWKDESAKCDIEIVSGKMPAFYSWDFMDFTRPGVDNSKDESKIRMLTCKAFYQGAIQSYCWHFWNPVTNESFYDTTAVVVSQLLPGGAYHEKYKTILRKIADYNATLVGKYGELIPIIFRPFHELDGSWFWWGANHCTPEEIKNLYRFTVQYLRDELGVRNFLYAFSPDCKYNTLEEYLERYPGDDYVDIIATDNYWDFRFNEGDINLAYKKLKIVTDYAKSKNKVAALTETGQRFIEDPKWYTQSLMKVIFGMQQKLPLSYVAVWRNSQRGYYVPFKGHAAESDFNSFVNDSRVIMGSKSELNGLYEIP